MAKEIKKKQNKQVKRFILEPYRGINSRFTCPACGHKHTFARFIDVTTGEYISEEFGRCNREMKCGYFKSPNGNDVGDKDLYVSINKVKEIYVEPNYISLIDAKYILRTFSFDYNQMDNLSLFLYELFPNKIDTVNLIRSRYKLSVDNSFWDKATVYWQIDQEYDIRTGKVMLYNKNTGKRVKEPYNHIAWLHNPTKSAKYGNNADYSLKQVFFGEHLLTDFSDIDTFHVVESEKTALLCSIYNPDTLWIATGGLQNINFDRLEPFANKKLIFYPDKGKAYKEWERKLKPFVNEFNIEISDVVEKSSKISDGDDIGDIIIKKITKK